MQVIVSMLVIASIGWAASLALACPGTVLPGGQCDADRNLVADPVTDSAQWLDPGTLVFSDVATVSPVLQMGIYAPLMAHLAAAVGRPVVHSVSPDYADQIARFKDGSVHITNLNTGSVEHAVACLGYVPLVLPHLDGELVGYRMLIITPPGIDQPFPDVLRGRQIAFTSERSNSGFKAPRAILKQQFDLLSDRDYTATFSGRHDNSVMGVVSGLYEAAAVADGIFYRLVNTGYVDEDDVQIVYRSRTFPVSPYGVSHRLKPTLAEALRAAFLSFDFSPLAEQIDYPAGTTLSEVDYEADWAVMRVISVANGATPACGGM